MSCGEWLIPQLPASRGLLGCQPRFTGALRHHHDQQAVDVG